MSELAKGPCESCPYRKDVPSGVWHPDEYDKLPRYDRPTSEQPTGAFMCHAVPEHLCFGWVACHQNRGHANELLALRFRGFMEDIPPSPVALFSSGAAACRHGKRKVDKPSRRAIALASKLLNKYERLRETNHIEGDD